MYFIYNYWSIYSLKAFTAVKSHVFPWPKGEIKEQMLID